jgi:hypothetical protein
MKRHQTHQRKKIEEIDKRDTRREIKAKRGGKGREIGEQHEEVAHQVPGERLLCVVFLSLALALSKETTLNKHKLYIYI